MAASALVGGAGLMVAVLPTILASPAPEVEPVVIRSTGPTEPASGGITARPDAGGSGPRPVSGAETVSTVVVEPVRLDGGPGSSYGAANGERSPSQAAATGGGGTVGQAPSGEDPDEPDESGDDGGDENVRPDDLGDDDDAGNDNSDDDAGNSDPDPDDD